MGSGPRQPALRTGSRGRTSAWLQTPLTTAQAAPPGTPSRHLHSAQRRLATAHALGPVLGPHANTTDARQTRVAETQQPACRDGRPGEGQCLTADAPHNGGRPTPPGQPPAIPTACSPPRGMQAKGTVLGPHARTPAPKARSGQRTPTAHREDGQPAEDERLTSDAPHNGARHPPRGRPPATPTVRNAGSQERTLWGRCWAPCPHQPCPGDTGNGSWLPAPRDERQGDGQRLTPDTPHNSGRPPPRDGPPPPPRHAAPRRACKSKGQCWAPTLAHPRPQQVGSGPPQPALRTGSRGRTSA